MLLAVSLLAGSPAYVPQPPLLRVRQLHGAATAAVRSTGPSLSLYDDYIAKRDGNAAPVVEPPEEMAPIPAEVVSAIASTNQPGLVTVMEPKFDLRPSRSVAKPDLTSVVKEASDLLSHQAIMENFVHHNPWESLQHLDWHEALEQVEEKSSYMSPGERLSKLVPLDPRVRANKAIAELGAPFLDRGLAKWEPPNRERGFLYFFASLEGLGNVPWRQHARDTAERITRLLDSDPEQDLDAFAASILEEELSFLEERSDVWTETTRAMMLDLPGWAGYFKRMEENPNEGPATCRDGMCQTIPVRLTEFIAVHAILTRSSIEVCAMKEGWNPINESLSEYLKRRAPLTKRRGERPRFGMGSEMLSLQNPSGLAYVNQNLNAMEELEQEYQRVTLQAINVMNTPEAGSAAVPKVRPMLQFYTCFDEREESFRRYIEASASFPDEIETFGVAGFFNMAIRHSAPNLRPPEILAPEGNCPPLSHFVEEKELTPGHAERKKLLAELSLAYERATFSPLSSLVVSAGLLPFQLPRLALKSFAPTTTRKLDEKMKAAFVPESKTDFAPPYTAEEAADRLGQLFKNVGEMSAFGRLVIATGHGARSLNNPFLAAYNCGACCGREGGPNARVMARCANSAEVRQLLRSKHGIDIPDDTWFVGGYHDTTLDLVELYDLDRVPASHKEDLRRATEVIDMARKRNALERTSKFYLTDVQTPEAALEHVETRGVDEAEVRPELGHSTNAAIVLGRRELTKGRFLDRRVFLPSYDPFNDDDEGTNLATVLTPALVVGSGISLEYFFSTTDGGAGTKAPVNVVGNFGLQQGTAGDLLIGLATQMSELHSPVRALYLIDAPVDRVEKVLGRNEVLMNIVRNNWVNFFVRDPYTQKIYQQKDGAYYPADYLFEFDYMDSNASPQRVARDYVPFDEPSFGSLSHDEWCLKKKKEEDIYTYAAAAIMVASAGFSLQEFDPKHLLIAASATTIGLSNLAFSRRYLHGEFMFGRMALSSAAMVAGFNLVNGAIALEDVSIGWTIIGFASSFLIGGFNDRPTARDNAAYAFGVYQISDAALLVAAAMAAAPGQDPSGATAFGLILAALIKSSQFPLNGLFLRSMEGSSPHSALGYAGLSAHVGPVLLASTMPMWFGFEWARLLVGGVGLVTAANSGIVANIRSDRKGSIASATSATLGLIFVVLAAGYDDLALALSLGHASVRINQVLRSPSSIQDHHKWEAALGYEQIAADKVYDFVWKFGWRINRIHNDYFRLPDAFASVDLKTPLQFYNSGATQFVVTWLILGAVSIFHLPVVEEKVIDLMQSEPAAAAALIALNVVGSTALVRFLFGNVLDFGRFRHE